MPAWGDSGEGADDEIPELPARYESEPDMNGIKTITTYNTNELGFKIKTVRTVKVAKQAIKIRKSVLARRKWAKFGDEAGKPAGYHGKGFTDAGITNLDANEQTLDMTPKARAAEENNESAQRAFEKMNMATFEAWRPKNRDGGVGGAKEWAEANGMAPRDDFGAGPDFGGGGGGSSLAQLAAGAGGKSSYVPPSMRNADGSRNTELAGQRDDSCTVRASNLSEDVKDSDLRELFRRFGAIQRIYLAKDRETQQSRGFAFINFFNREDAQNAINKLDGHGYDHLILSVSWANPSAGPTNPQAPPTGAAFGPALGERPRMNLQPAGGAGRTDVTNRFDSHVFDSGLDRFRT